MNEPIVTIVGTLTSDLDLRFTPSGVAVASGSVAVNSRKKEGDKWVDGETSFYRCSVWKNLGENAAESLRKGDRVIVTGRQSIRNYEDNDGNKRTSVDITADEIGPSLKWATAEVRKNERKGPENQSQDYSAEEAPY